MAKAKKPKGAPDRAHPKGATMAVEQKVRDDLKELRLKRGWTQKQLADRAGLSSVAISNFESDDTSPESTRTKQPRKAAYAAIVRALKSKDKISDDDEERLNLAFREFVEIVAQMDLADLNFLIETAKRTAKSI